LGPFFERFFILGGPRGTRWKKLQSLDPRKQQHGMKIMVQSSITHMSINYCFRKRSMLLNWSWRRRMEATLKCILR
jgi:hypothetical protein